MSQNEIFVKNTKNKYFIVLGVLCLSAVTAFWMLPSMSLRSHECLVSVTAREMLQNHDYIWPTMNGIPRLQKTPLCYWIVAGVAKLTGTVDELSVRLPSALFAFLSAVAVLYYLSRWLSLRIAVLSTAVWATSLAYARLSHRARPDMVMTFFIVLCMLSFYSIVIAENRRQQVIGGLVFWLSFALANLAKGPAPVPYVLIPVAVYIIFSKQWHIVAKMMPFIGSFLFLVIFLPWLLFISHRLNWDLTLWKHEFFDRLFGNYAQGNYAFYYYLPDMFKYITPWVVFLPIALFTPFYKVWRGKRPLMTYLWIWFVADTIFLTVDAGKRQHYILPLIPPMAILIGIVLNDMIFSRKAYLPEFAKNILIAHVIVLTAAALISPVVIAFIAPELVTKVLMLSLTTVIFLIAVTILFAKQKPEWAAISVFSGVAVFILMCFYNFSVIADIDANSRNFAKKIACLVPASDKLIAYKDVSSRFVQYYGQVVPQISNLSKLREYYNKGCWIVCFSDDTIELKNENLNIVYSCERKGKSKSDTAGVLFHNPANAEKTLETYSKQ
jgi:4-amino-4-deoxy-L-arabinose transferase-like glycosyltransferase